MKCNVCKFNDEENNKTKKPKQKRYFLMVSTGFLPVKVRQDQNGDTFCVHESSEKVDSRPVFNFFICPECGSVSARRT